MATNLREAPDLPEMPEVENVRPMPFRPAGQLATRAGGGIATLSMGQQLRRLLALFSFGGIGIAAFLMFWQSVAAPGKGPFELLAAAESKFEVGRMNGNMGIGPDGKQLTEAGYREALAEAERRGAAKAEYALQEKIATLQANQQRIVGAYQALYQRANMIAQAGLEMEAQLQTTRAQAVAGAEAGQTMIATYGDIFCALGAQGGCAAANQAREKIKTDIDNARTGAVGTRIKELMSQVPDTASLVAGSDVIANGPPSLPAGGTGQ